jgi:hypothetical protein
MQTARNQRERRFQREKGGTPNWRDLGRERWSIRAVTGTIAEQRRDDETGCPGRPPLLASGPAVGRTGDTEE